MENSSGAGDTCVHYLPPDDAVRTSFSLKPLTGRPSETIIIAEPVWATMPSDAPVTSIGVHSSLTYGLLLGEPGDVSDDILRDFMQGENMDPIDYYLGAKNII
jgi:hypothetical protein